MDTQIFQDIGLTKTETKIYLALLKLGQSTTTNIVKDSGVHASKVYEFLNKLIQKGLVSYVVKSNKKYFTAAEPEFLKGFLKQRHHEIEEQEKAIDRILPELKSIRKSAEDLIHSETYEGLRGLKSIYEKIFLTLKKGETQYVIGAPRIANELIEGFLLEWHRRRVKKGIKCRYIYDSNVRDYGREREKMPLTSVRYLSKNIVSPMWIEIFGDYVMTGHIKGRNVILFLIYDKEIAHGYMDYFNLIWHVSKR